MSVIDLFPPEVLAAANAECPEVEVRLDEGAMADDVLAHLAKRPNFYQRGGALVRIAQETEGPRVNVMAKATVREEVTRAVRFVRWNDKDGKFATAKIPQDVVNALHVRGGWEGVPPLNGITECPVLRPSGGVLQKPGYDAETGLFYAPNEVFPNVADAPTRDDARAAAAALLDVVSDFPFQDDTHRSAWLALALTPIARPAIGGCVPLGLIDKNVRGAGGTLLCEIIGLLYSGSSLARMTQTEDDEMRKQITTIAMNATPIVLIDNVKGKLGGYALEAALTSHVWQDRALGSNTIVRVPLRTLWLASGNNASVTGDLVRRTLHVRLESPDERPEERTTFRRPDVRGYVQTNRPALVAAALTILRGYVVAGCPDQRLPAWGSFEGWSFLVRGALVWAGLPDPRLSCAGLIETGDPEINAIERVMAGWVKPMTTTDVVREIRTSPLQHMALAEALAELCRCSVDRLDAHKIGYSLRKLKGRVVGGKTFTGGKTMHGVAWQVTMR